MSGVGEIPKPGGGIVTNQEINEAVARKLGVYPSNETIAWAKSQVTGAGEFKITIADYCTDIRAAWEIIPIGIWNIIETNSKKWRASCWMSKTKKWYWAEADTAPMAICLAFLKLEDK